MRLAIRMAYGNPNGKALSLLRTQSASLAPTPKEMIKISVEEIKKGGR